MVKVLPSSTTLSTRTSPPCCATSSLTSASPMPVPSWVRPRALCTRWKRSKRWGSSWAGMPVPVSVTRRRTASSVAVSRTVSEPVKVNLSALESRLKTTFSHICRST
ncbi:hypothetical protein COSO111634_36595 [Corallococcus soli]